MGKKTQPINGGGGDTVWRRAPPSLKKNKEETPMEKRLNKPYERNVRLQAATGQLGIPPRAAMFGGDTYIIVTDRQRAERFVSEILGTKSDSLPQ